MNVISLDLYGNQLTRFEMANKFNKDGYSNLEKSLKMKYLNLGNNNIELPFPIIHLEYIEVIDLRDNSFGNRLFTHKPIGDYIYGITRRKDTRFSFIKGLKKLILIEQRLFFIQPDVKNKTY